MITKENVEKSFNNLIKALETTQNSTDILMSLDDLTHLTITIGYSTENPTFFIIGDAFSTLSYHLKNIYSRFIPGLVPREIQTAAASKVNATLGQVRKSVKIVKEELLKKDEPEYKVLMDNIGKIYMRSYDLFKFGSSYVVPTAESE